ncbi:S49 family peptidase [Azospirillum sp. B4]|uniref:S49 family peptidase n=1 Tax=Azospirillum sp. B4 TaxID=95605 RepID=UPI00034A41D3|nr:S49 family peptidase [Azospirillum sp. B4]
MKRHPLFLGSLLNRPHLMERAAAGAVLAVLRPDARMDGAEIDVSAVECPHDRDYQVAGGVAIIPVLGKLVHRGTGLSAPSGVCSYQSLADMTSDAPIGRDDVKAILFDLDSMGGEGGGCLDYADWLRSMRGVKPMWAVVNSRATSAAYAIASACDRVLTSEDGFSGSVGVIAMHVDESKALEAAGLDVTVLYKGDRKPDGISSQPLSAEAQRLWQGDINGMYERFCRVVAAGRGMTVEAVQATQAAVYRGQDAINVGFADQIATFEEALMSLQTKTAPTGARVINPGTTPAVPPSDGEADLTTAQVITELTTRVPDGALAAGAPFIVSLDAGGNISGVKVAAASLAAADVADMCAKAGYPDLIAGLLRRSSLTTADVTARLDEARGIADACAKFGVPQMAADLIRGGVSLDVARSLAASMSASVDQARVTDTTHVPQAAATTRAPTLDHASVYARMNSGKGTP